MANIPFNIVYSGDKSRSIVGLWDHVTDITDVLEWADLGNYSDRSVQISGNFNGAHMAVEGSNDLDRINPTNVYELSDMSGVALLWTAPDLIQVGQCTHLIRPKVKVDGGASMDLSIRINCVLGR